MRLAEDTDSWRASGVVRRDFRSSHGDPEVARRARVGRRRVPPILCPRGEGGPHCPERYAIRISRRPVVVREGMLQEPSDETPPTHLLTETRWAFRCAHCRTTAMAPKLLAGVADLLDGKELSALLASAWCRDGHLIDDHSEEYDGYRQRYPDFLRSSQAHCVMCGKRIGGWYGPVRITDRGLLEGAGIPRDIVDRMLMGRGHPDWAPHGITRTVDPIGGSS